MSEEDRNTVLYEVSDQIATVTLNRPETLNAITDQLTSELYDVMQTAASDRKVRAIILTGAGRAFCAGGDITGFGNQTPQDLITKLPRQFDMNRRPDFQTRHTYFPAIAKPIIGMINGAAAGLGLLYALFCDIRFASEHAVLTTAFARRGLGAEYGMAWILTELVGHANALDLLISGRKVKGDEALRLGLVNQIHPQAELASATYAYAKEIVTWCAPSSMRMMKRAVYDVPFQSLHEAVMLANQDMLVSNVSADFKEGTASFREKRPPKFQDL
ncbi:MAG: enoyl-CoA hydratase [Xanthobacteraceae bacterium]|nr:enoyl-CoA hydratase [Xanthobacteraceae bacterium]